MGEGYVVCGGDGGVVEEVWRGLMVELDAFFSGSCRSKI